MVSGLRNLAKEELSSPFSLTLAQARPFTVAMPMRNPVKDIDAPKLKKTLPRYLTLDESISLLESVDGPNRERDLCILTLFLNCGLRISELIGLNLSDVHEDALRVLGKGNKVRMVYLNQACLDTLRDYLAVRRPITGPDRDALFLSARNQRKSEAKRS